MEGSENIKSEDIVGSKEQILQLLVPTVLAQLFIMIKDGAIQRFLCPRNNL